MEFLLEVAKFLRTKVAMLRIGKLRSIFVNKIWLKRETLKVTKICNKKFKKLAKWNLSKFT
jgi:hypothetical protein